MNTLSGQDDMQRRQAAAMHISMSLQRSGRIMEVPAVITDIREHRMEGATWKEVTREMKPDLLENDLARKVDFHRLKYFKILAGTVARAHNDRRDSDREIRGIKDAITGNPELDAMVMEAIHEHGSYSTPLRIPAVRDLLANLGVRPRSIDKDNRRFSDATKKERGYEIRNFNRLARVAFGELHLAQLGQFDEMIWEEKR